MFAIAVEFLLGRSVAASRWDRDEPEWPPHPDRLFCALVAAWGEGPFGEAERAALEWLERLPPPALVASDAAPRSAVNVYVPVNDAAAPGLRAGRTPSADQSRAAAQVLPERRSRQLRHFPTVVPAEPVVHFIWRDAEPGIHRRALSRLVVAATALGHSSSLIRAALVEDPPEPTLVPAESGDHRLRVSTPGRLAELEDAFRRDERPDPGLAVAYAAPTGAAHAIPRGRFGELVVFRLDDGPRLGLRSAGLLTSAVRDALMTAGDQPPAEIVSGHTATGAPSSRPHMAVLPLAHVGSRWADGRVLGFAVALPRDVDRDGQRVVYRAIARWSGERGGRLTLGRVGAWTAARVSGPPERHSLDTWPYVRPARRWATVTPLVLDRFPRDREGRRPEDIVAQACRNVGLDVPLLELGTGDVSPLRGAPHRREVVTVRHDGVPPRPLLHAWLTFAEPVAGPLLLGAGRYLGFGLLRSVPDAALDEPAAGRVAPEGPDEAEPAAAVEEENS